MAYMDVFRGMGVIPEEIILMPGDINKLEEVRSEDKYDYSKYFFDLNFDLFEYVSNCGAVVKTVSSNDINGVEIQKALEKCACEYILFTGGGILGQHILSLGKYFIHIHPGFLPEYRGSTCFYYSIMEKGYIGSTAFIMAKEIDSGRYITRSKFSINYSISPQQPLFMDYILDPYIRAFTLRKVLNIYIKNNTLPTYKQKASSIPAYYVMHPLLRHISIIKINSMFNNTSNIGVQLLDYGK